MAFRRSKGISGLEHLSLVLEAVYSAVPATPCGVQTDGAFCGVAAAVDVIRCVLCVEQGEVESS